MLKTLRHALEATFLYIVLWVFRLLPLETASNLGGFIARSIGPKLKVSRIAQKNLARFLPEERDHHAHIIKGMWDNLGRVVAELPHFSTMDANTLQHYITVHNSEVFEHIKNSDTPVFFFSGHFGNWEALGKVAWARGAPVSLVYRSANNPFVDRLIQRLRDRFQRRGIPKGKAGARELLQSLQSGHAIGMLVDQKMNDGIPVPFFGVDAMTAPAIATLAQKYDVPVIPACIVREKGPFLTYRSFPPITITPSGDAEQDTLAFMTEINRYLEDWIRQHPEQWFWLHNRWPNA